MIWRFLQLQKTGDRIHAADLFRGARTVLLSVALISPPVWSAQQQQGQPKPSGPTEESSSSRDSATYNPLPAEQDVEVGTFYMRKGDIDAAIARFQHAVGLQPKLAKARLLLAKAYEKKGDKEAAVKCYREYLQVFPNASDAKKIQKRIEKLSAPKG